MKKKLLIFHPIIAPYRIDLFNAFVEHYDCKVVLYWRNLRDQTFDYSNIESQLSFTPKYLVKDEVGRWTWYTKLWQEINQMNPDLILVPEFGVCTILTLLNRLFMRKHYKIICITDDSFNMLSSDNYFTGRHKKAIGFMAPMIDEFINVEPKSAQWYQNHFNKGVYFPIIAEDSVSRTRLERIIPISQKYITQYNLEGKKVLLFVGRLVSIKNVKFVINAFEKANIKDSVFVIVGSGEQESELKEIALPYDNVLLVGRFEGDELYAWYNVAQVFTLPSVKEPFGAVTNEALIAGCKSLISIKAGSNCLIKNEENGYVIDPNDEKLYIYYLKKLMDSVTPISLPIGVKQNLMPTSFKKCVNDLFGKIDSIL